MNSKDSASSPGSADPTAPIAPRPQARILVVEDSARDMKDCLRILRELGVGHIDATTTVSAAILRLERVLEGNELPPNLIILDLSFTLESGFEVLRRWKAEPRLKSIPIIIWSAMGDTEQKLCEYFGVRKFVPKWEGLPSLEKAVRASV